MSDLQLRELRDRLDGLTIRDAARLERRLKNLRGDSPEKIAEQIAAAEGVIASRLAAVPTITYPDLPVTDRRGEIAKAITDNQVVIVAGETGSGKTTQLPKICLELGRGIRGTIGYDKWAGIFASQWMKVLTFAVIVALLYHVWVGMRDVWMDYIKPVGARLVLQIFTIVWLLGCASWAIQVLWRL